MTSLLPDSSYCTTELGRLVFESKLEWSGRCYVVDAKEIANSLSVKFVTYTCVIVMTPKQSLGQDERSFVLSTRYKTLSKLHSALLKLHSQLYLKSAFPPFPEAKWIGGNDAATIAERKAATEMFLSFLLSQEVLRKARLFHQFIETAEEKVADAEIVDVSSTLTVGTGLLDSSNIIPATIAPIITPENDSRPSSSLSTHFHFDDVSIEEAFAMSNQGRGFIREYLSKFAKKNGSEEYLVVAGRLVSTAQLAETEGAYEAAFYSYKEAASVLIKGMESEKSQSNRNAVRLKSAKFIEKAEQIYRNHLRYDNAPLFDMTNIPRDAEDSFAFRSSNCALLSFQFMGVLPDVEARKRVFLVHQTESGGYFVMKLIERREGGEGGGKRDGVGEAIFLPTNVPHMVPLIKFFTTTNYIILLLQYVKTGRLWSFLCRYLAESERKYEEKERRDANEDFVETEEQQKENPYRGRHTRFSVTADCERLAVMENEGLEDAGEAAVICAVGEDVMGREDEGDKAKYILVPSDTVDGNTMIVEEEAPAPVTISMKEGKEKEEGKEREGGDWQDDYRSMSLSDAMAECRDCLKESKRCWLGVIPESLIIHWSAQCISMLYVLHSHGAFIGDLHPDNLLIDEEGNLLFTYQAHWNNDARDRHLLAGYAAPECSSLLASPSIVSSPCDIWSLGALLYELILGRPLSTAAPHGIGNLSDLPFIPDSTPISFSARDLLYRILHIDPLERITIDQIRAHPFYSSINWLLYDNPHGPGRISMNRKEKEKEKERGNE
ncbi:hypothetical protein PENTCL1PPCAC_2264, partial [Pristionchus entomophagus]